MMLVAAQHIKGGVAEEIQGALVRRCAFETDDKVLAMMDAGSELPKRIVELIGSSGGGIGGMISVKDGAAAVHEKKEEAKGGAGLGGPLATIETVASSRRRH